MDKAPLALAGLALAGAALLTGCGAGHGDRCDSPTVMYYSDTDHVYHYGSVNGPKVPATKVPQGARNQPGYKPYKAPHHNSRIGKH